MSGMQLCDSEVSEIEGFGVRFLAQFERIKPSKFLSLIDPA